MDRRGRLHNDEAERSSESSGDPEDCARVQGRVGKVQGVLRRSGEAEEPTDGAADDGRDELAEKDWTRLRRRSERKGVEKDNGSACEVAGW